MSELTGDQRIAVTYTIRAVPTLDGTRYSRNRHYWLLNDAGQFGAVTGIAEPLGVAERHLMHPACLLHSMVTILLQKPTELLEELQAVGSYVHGYGGRNDTEDAPPEPYPTVLVLRKYCAYGRNSRAFVEGALATNELARDDAPRVHLLPAFDSAGILSSYYNSFMASCPLPAVTIGAHLGETYPSSYREIIRYGGFTAERITSIPDAQKRKTYKARPYQARALATLEDMRVLGALSDQIAHLGYPTFDQSQKQLLLDTVGTFLNQLVYISQYYGQGKEPDFADCWRPSAGLNPNSDYAQMVLQKCADQLTGYGQAIADLPADDDGNFQSADLGGALPLYDRACGLYMLFLDNERFTGTPKYISRFDSQCRAGAPVAV